MEWQPGHKLKSRDYEIETVLGEGGFGITYKAKDLSLDIPIVIKTPNSKLQRNPNYAKYVEKFRQEARQLAQLGLYRHPHIVRVISSLFEEEDNLPCFAMDFIPGLSLYHLVQIQGPLSETKALEYIEQIGSALVVCHGKGIIHRDVHPNNILIRQDNNQAVLIDFGIAATMNTSRYTHSGNQAFAPWEQIVPCKETEKSKTPQVDIYTLAASLYYLVTGKEPTPGIARKFSNQELQPPEELNSSLSDSISQAISRGMEVEPENRPDSIEKWLKLLLPPVAPQPKPPLISQTKTEVRAPANPRVTTQKNTIPIIDQKEEEYQKQKAEQQRKQQEYENKLGRYKREFLTTVELEYPLTLKCMLFIFDD
ncbi:MAG: serine/threonine-protein kinase [Xenococcaceae cyanobacterium MO_188.B19]|nr:serine/threonine-protein kinase [Xenococcaceae cyanobacterium MO_188.B19]